MCNFCIVEPVLQQHLLFHSKYKIIRLHPPEKTYCNQVRIFFCSCVLTSLYCVPVLDPYLLTETHVHARPSVTG